MNPTKYRNPGRAAARAFAAMALAATSFLVPGAANAADEATADTADVVTTEEATTAGRLRERRHGLVRGRRFRLRRHAHRPRRHHGDPGPRPR